MDWIAITCWVVLGASGLLALWALFWDRPRGRLRCRKCAYDMSGGGLVCPECGREHKTERSLKRTRRKWKTATSAVVIGTFALYAKHQRDLIAYEGWYGFVPSCVLVALVDPDTLVYDPRLESAGAVLERRVSLVRMSLPTRRYYIWKLHRKHLDDEDSEFVPRIYDLSRLSRVSHTRTRRLTSSRYVNGGVMGLVANDICSFELISAIINRLEAFDTARSSRRLQVVGDQILVRGTLQDHAWISEALSDLHSSTWDVLSGGAFQFQGDETVGIVYSLPVRLGPDPALMRLQAYAVYGELQSIDSASWVRKGGRDAQVALIGRDRFAVWASPDMHRAIMEHLATVDFEALVR